MDKGYDKQMIDDNINIRNSFLSYLSKNKPLMDTDEYRKRCFFNMYEYFDTDKKGIFKKGDIKIKVEFGDLFEEMKVDGELLFEHFHNKFNPMYIFYFLKKYIEEIEEKWSGISKSEKA